ncbi:MAG: prepilin-type N-terminal cleavage/methylation domain-containing protein [Armatimonadota bacterium]
MNRRGMTLMETLVAISIFTVLLTIALRLFFLTDRVLHRERTMAAMERTLSTTDIQSQLRQDIWKAADCSIGPGEAVARFTFADGAVVRYVPSMGKTLRRDTGGDTTLEGSVRFTRLKDGIIFVSGDTGEPWDFTARMRNYRGDEQ